LYTKYKSLERHLEFLDIQVNQAKRKKKSDRNRLACMGTYTFVHACALLLWYDRRDTSKMR
jgi:hypothetical protein